MVVIILVLLSLGVALFVMLSDTRRNNNFKKLEQQAIGHDAAVADTSPGSTAEAGPDGSSGGD